MRPHIQSVPKTAEIPAELRIEAIKNFLEVIFDGSANSKRRLYEYGTLLHINSPDHKKLAENFEITKLSWVTTDDGRPSMARFDINGMESFIQGRAMADLVTTMEIKAEIAEILSGD